MIRNAANRKLCEALETLVAEDAPLKDRLTVIAATLSTLSSNSFADHRLRRQFRALRDEMILLGLVDEGPDAAAANLSRDEAMTLAVRLLDLCFWAALRNA